MERRQGLAAGVPGRRQTIRQHRYRRRMRTVGGDAGVFTWAGIDQRRLAGLHPAVSATL